MARGLLFALAACFIWGLIFIIPEYLTDFSPIEITLGRYLVYGSLSSILLMRKGIFYLKRFPLRVWAFALVFALISNLFYYLGIVVGLRYATPPVTIMILGLCPLIITFYGNWQTKEYRYRDLLVPCLAIFLGIVLVNVKEIDWSFETYSPGQYIFGLLGILCAVAGWSWYAVQNARFLKKNVDVPKSEWATMIGISTLIWSLIIGGILVLAHSAEIDLNRFAHFSDDTMRFLGAVLILGVLCSWMGCYLWNQASSYLPLSLMGPFIIFETVFGLTFVFIYELRFPSLMELSGIGAMMSGILLAIRNRNRKACADNTQALS